MRNNNYPYKIIKPEIISELQRSLSDWGVFDTVSAGPQTEELIRLLHASIPDKKRISIGRYSVVMELGIFILESGLLDIDEILDAGSLLYKNTENDTFVRSLGIQLASLYAQETGDLDPVMSLFRKASEDEDWIVRECSSGFIRKLVKSHNALVKPWYLEMAVSDNPLHRRFASESLRPVAENRWFKNAPDFAFSVLKLLYTESSPYPRTSAGNSLSDWLRINPELTFPVVKQLAESGNPDSHWIAYRACRNLVKKDPLLVLDLLNIDEYKYKDRHFKRKDFITDDY